jgi:hypothetical protein
MIAVGYAMKTLLRFALCLAWPIFLTACWSYVSADAQSRFEMQRAGFSVSVYPVNISRQGNGTAADFRLGRELSDWLNARRIANARFSQPGVPVRVEWHANQAKMAEHSAKAFGTWVQQTGITTDYALLAEILCNGDETKVIGVHYYLAEKSGVLAAGGLTNSHWDEFKRINPTDRSGGLAVLKEILEKRMLAPTQP